MQLVLIGLAIGLAVGVFSGLIGVGGGIILVPLLVYGFSMDQHTAQGTSLTMLLPPTGLLAFWKYYKAGHTNVKLGLILAIGVFAGGFLGGLWAQQIPATSLRKGFAVVLVGVAVKMFFQK
jgi:hypothetical protein